MKIKDNITKLQQGGIPLPVFTYNPLTQANNVNPGVVEQGTTPSDNKEGNNSQKEIVKNLLDQIKTKGLPSDVESFFGSFSGIFPSFFGNTSSNSNPFSSSNGDNDYNSMVNNYMSMLPKLNRITFNKENWDESMKNVVKNEALDEFAITSNGLMIVYNEDGELKQVRQKEYLENRDEYQPVTNAELANVRANNPNLAWDTTIFSSLNTGIGTNKITEQVLNIMTKVGKEKYTSDKVGSKTSNILKGIQHLINEGPNNVFYQSTESVDSQKKNAQEALKYIYSTLPNNSKAVLRTRAATMGLDPDKGAYEIIATLMSGVTNHEESTSIKIDKDPNFDYESGRSNKDKMAEFNQAEQLITGNGIRKDVLINTSKSYNSGFTTEAVHHPSIIGNNGNPIAATSLENALNDSYLGGLINWNSIYLGDKKVDVTSLKNVVYMGTGINEVMLPYKVAYDDKTGNRVSVDFEMLEKYNEIRNEIKNKFPNGIPNQTIANDMFKNIPGVTYNVETKKIDYNPNIFKSFATVEVAINDRGDMIEDIDDSIVLTRDKSDSMEDFVYDKLSTKDNKAKIGDIYTGIAFLPLIGNINTAQTASGNLPKRKRDGDGSYYQAEAYTEQVKKEASFIKGDKSKYGIGNY